MSIARVEEYTLEQKLFAYRGQEGVQAMLDVLKLRQQKLNDTWYNTAGDDLLAMQGEARNIAKLIRMINVGPTPMEKK